MLTLLITMSALLTNDAAAAGRCDAFLRAADTAKGATLIKAYTDLTACDPEVAKTNFTTFMRASGDIETLTELAIAAIDKGTSQPVFAMLDGVPYESRDPVARAIGERCATNARIPSFLQAAHGALRGPTFKRWEAALTACSTPDFVAWEANVIRHPPSGAYDEGYAAVISAYIRRERNAALPALVDAAKATVSGEGPFELLVEKLGVAIQPLGGGKPSEADAAAYLGALRELAAVAKGERARLVAERLAEAGDTGAAAGLLPKIYADRLDGGKLVYGAVAVESCDGQAVLHVARVTEPGKRWTLEGDVAAPLRASKAKLKCAAPEWPVFVSPEPVVGDEGVAAFAEEIGAAWRGRNLTVVMKAEKALGLN
jgi:hypothetical protein